jgi:CelD/BcsL family acetyltransferase involved in cellulose biosynthesis
MNVFSSPSFLDALATTYFPGRRAEIVRYAVEGHEFQLLRVDGKKPLTTWPLVDYWEPVGPDIAPAGSSPTESAATEPATSLRSLPRVALETVAVDGRPTELGAWSPSPLLRFDRFTGWPDVAQLLHARAPRVAADSRRRLRRIERDLGAVTLSLADADDAAVDACIAWKVEQFRGAARLYRDRRHTTFLRTLRDRGVAQVATLRSGDRLLAVHIGLRHEGRFSSWVPAYDTVCSAYAPGRLLLEHLVQSSCERGDAEFDFLVGNEPYKWQYATHTRLVGPLGPQPWLPEATLRLRRRLRLGRKYLAVRERLAARPSPPGG